MSGAPTVPPALSSLVWATDIDVLPIDRVVERRPGYIVVRSPSNPTHYWGNLLLFDAPPGSGDGERWEQLFTDEFATDALVSHTTFAWDRIDGVLGASDEFVARGYELEETVGLVATRDQIRHRARENRAVEIRALDPARDAALWSGVLELAVATRAAHHPEASFRRFASQRLSDLRTLFGAGQGAYYVAIHPAAPTDVIASCGLVVTGGRGRFQSVQTAPDHRNKGIGSRLVCEAAHRSAGERFVIAADPAYHALGLYESLGFTRAERVAGLCRSPHPKRRPG